MGGVIGEAFIALRPTLTGFGTAARAEVDSELGAADVFGGFSAQGKKAADDLSGDIGRGAKAAEGSVDKATTGMGKALGVLGTQAGSWGIPFTGAAKSAGSELDHLTAKGKTAFEKLASVGKGVVLVGAAAAVAIGAESVHLASGLQQSGAQIAGAENISVAAANRITNAFLDTGGKTIYSANEQATAFTAVSGELSQMEGHALSAGQAQRFLASTGDLAEATQGDLGAETSTVAGIMQAFGVKLKTTNRIVNDLYNTARVTGTGVTQLGNTMTRLKARLGVAAPSVADLGTLLVDLNEHGIKGSRGLLVVNSAANTLFQSVSKNASALKSLGSAQAAVAKAQADVQNAQAAAATKSSAAQAKSATSQANAAAKVQSAQLHLQQVQERIAASTTATAPTVSQNIELQNAQLAITKAQADAAKVNSAAQTGLASSNSAVASAQAKLAAAQAKVNTLLHSGTGTTGKQLQAMTSLGLQVFSSTGKFVGFQSVISQLAPKLKAMTNAQGEQTQQQQLAALSTVFGTSANKALLDTVLAGPAAYDKAKKAVENSTTAHKAAEKQSKTLAREVTVIKAEFKDEGDKLGIWLIPKLEILGHDTVNLIQWFQKHKEVTKDLAIALAVVLGGAVAAFVVNSGAKFLNYLDSAGKKVTGLASSIKTKVTSIGGSNSELAGSTEEASSKISGSTQSIEGSFESISAAAQTAEANVAAAFAGMTSSAATAAGELTTSAGTIETEFGAMKSSESGLLIPTGATPVPAGAAGASAQGAVAGEEGAVAGAAAGKAGAGEAGATTVAEGEIAGVGGAAGAASKGLSGLVGPTVLAAAAAYAAFHAYQASEKAAKEHKGILGKGGQLTAAAHAFGPLSAVATAIATPIAAGIKAGFSHLPFVGHAPKTPFGGSAAKGVEAQVRHQSTLAGKLDALNTAIYVYTGTAKQQTAFARAQSAGGHGIDNSEKIVKGLEEKLATEKTLGASHQIQTQTRDALTSARDHLKSIEANFKEAAKDRTIAAQAQQLKNELEKIYGVSTATKKVTGKLSGTITVKS